ncbi:hypothetical protein [Virgibacillus halodenitrificans]|uniref:hypothetical protein n=1 Tax=Virgibacillus halodenitrificans TaxID=1482 RepID=UPI002DBE63E3|nr:hypothetical protein [Virgibacillus halodenitrificans]MEC2159754.1 hypothetical protein [Virgibacillus halodenitrificans]
MRIFQYQGQEEDHYTNILMNILKREDCRLAIPFIRNILRETAQHFTFKELKINTRVKYCSQEEKKYEYIIGIAPYKRAIEDRKKYEDNSGSIPDAWICGSNFNLLFEFKIRGVLDENQLAAHKKLLRKDAKIIRLTWADVISSLEKIHVPQDSIDHYLLNEFLRVTDNFKSKRRASGMPTQIISGINKKDKCHFIITGSRNIKVYTVEISVDGNKQMLHSNLRGIQEARRWIADYVLHNHEQLGITFEGMNTEVTDYCVVPGRAEKKNSWNQWRLGGFL